MEPKEFIFDLDGVITDTARYHYWAWKQLADELGYHFTQTDNERLKGVTRLQSFEIILEINNATDKYSQDEKIALADRKNEYYKTMLNIISENDVLEKIPTFLSEVKSLGIKIALASVSHNAKTIVNRLGIQGMFDYIADPAQIHNSKPDPEIFLACANALGLSPMDCIGFEDSQAGISAIHAAGMFSVGIGVKVTCLAPDLILSSTAELDIQQVIKSFQNANKSI